MVKLFPEMLAELEKYNPEDTFANYTQTCETFDEKGLLHSYNDEPSMVEIEDDGFRIIVWHSHGEIYREDNPAYVILSFDSFRTFDNEHELHSFHGMPSRIDFDQNTIDLDWHDHGTIHRENDLPARVTANHEKIVEYEHYVQGVGHRANNQPSSFNAYSTAWEVKGQLHNAEGHSNVELERKGPVSHINQFETWYLYGVQLTEETFKTIKALETQKTVPLWVAFLHTFEIIGDIELTLFLNDSGLWDETFPINWVLKSWGVTNERFSIKIREQYQRDGRTTLNSSFAPLKSFLEIAEFERTGE
jgi:hypothetical protein